MVMAKNNDGQNRRSRVKTSLNHFMKRLLRKSVNWFKNSVHSSTFHTPSNLL